jgi:hypothetical protein
MLQIKAYVDLSPYDEVTTFTGAEAERVVRSFIVTGEGGTLISQIIESLAAPRGAAAAQIISGKRGAGKSHLLAFLRALIGVNSLRATQTDARLTSALRLLADRTPVALELNFAGQAQPPFEAILREAIHRALGEADDFNDERWARAVGTERVFEQVISALPLDAQLILFLDNLSARWRAAPQLVENDLKWLMLIAEQADRLPLRAVVALDESDFGLRLADSGLLPERQAASAGSPPALRPPQFDAFLRHARIHYLSPDNLNDLVAHHLLRKTPRQMNELGTLYQRLKEQLPSFAWPEEEFVAYYPAHPALSRLAPMIRAHSRSFSLPGFIASAAARALNRPALSLVVLDEVFDRYEYELRKDDQLEAAFALYDQLAAKAASALAVPDRLWARMLAKSLFLFSLTAQPVNLRTLADAQLLMEEGEAEGSYARAARILAQFEQVCPEALYAEGEGLERSYLLASARASVPLEDLLAVAARELTTDDPRLAELLVVIGGHVFPDWQLTASADGSGRIPSAPGEVLWRGTLRRGEVSFGGAEDAEAGLIAGLTLAGETEDDLLGVESEAGMAARASDDGGNWRLVLVPFNCDLDLEAPSASTLAVRWRAGLLAGEASLQPLKMLTVLNARAEDLTDQREEIERVAAQLHEQIRALFADLYLERGSLVDHRGPQPIPPACRRAASFAEFLSHALDSTLSSCFPDHPRFEGTLREDQVEPLVVNLFANAVNNEVTCELAGRFALPLGLVTPAEGAYRLNIFSDLAVSQSFVHRLFALMDKYTESSGLANVPLAEVYRALGGVPCGLQPPAQHLLLGALIASGLVELVNDETGERLSGATLHLGFHPGRYTALRRVAPMDYPIEILTVWANQFTERLELPAPATAEARRRVREALGQWLAQWREQNLAARVEQAPLELLTMSTWEAASASKRRFERAAAVIEAVLKETIALEAGLSRIVDIFGFDLGVLEHTRAEVQLLGDFLDWVPAFVTMKNYLHVAEVTGVEELDRVRRHLLDNLYASRKLLDPQRRRELGERFESWRQSYGDFYAAAHEANVGAAAYHELIESFYAGAEWTNFKLLARLKLDRRAFERDAEALANLVRETRCELAIAEILLRQPHCLCSFRLNRRLHLGSLLDALKAVTAAAATYYCHTLWLRQAELRERWRGRGPARMTEEIEAFLAACAEGRLEGLTPDIVGVLNECLPEPEVTAAIPALPNLDHGSYTKEELREQLTRWLESLPEEDGLRFRVERA